MDRYSDLVGAGEIQPLVVWYWLQNSSSKKGRMSLDRLLLKSRQGWTQCPAKGYKVLFTKQAQKGLSNNQNDVKSLSINPTRLFQCDYIPLPSLQRRL